MGFHLTQLDAERFERIAGFLEHAAVTAELAGIVIGDLLAAGDLLHLETSGLDLAADEFGDRHDFERQRLIQLFGRIEAQRRIGMSAFRHDHQFCSAGARRIGDPLCREHLAVFAAGKDTEVGCFESFAADRPGEA